VVAVVFWLAGCGSDAPAGEEPEPAGTADGQAAVLAAVDVRASGCGPNLDLGAGSVVDEGLVVTVAHVVAGTDAVQVFDTQGNGSAGTVVWFDPDNDVAALRVDPELGLPLPPRDELAASGELGVLVAPREVDGEMSIDVAEIEVLRPARILTTDIYREADVTRDGFEMEADVREGDSGAMVVLPGGGVGILWARSNERPERAWGVNLPNELLDPDTRATLIDPVDTGRCDD
jgi:hypothetical protein